MTNRSMTVAMLAEIAKLQQRTGHLYEIYLDSGTVYATDFFLQVTWNGNTYLALGHFIGYDGVEENVELMVNDGQIYLSGIDQEWISNVLGTEILNRRAVIRRIHLDASWSVILDPVPVRDGLMDSWQIQEDEDSGKSTVMVTVRNHLVDFDRRPGRHTNDQEQRLHFPDDGIFKYCDQLNRKREWKV